MIEIPPWLASLTVGEALLWVGGIVGAILAMWKGWPVFRALVAAVVKFIKLVDTLATLPDELETIKHELQANSGKSVKDIATRTEQAVGELATGQDYQRKQLAALKTSVSKTNRRLSDHIDQSINNKEAA